MADSEKNIRAFLAIEPPERILQTVAHEQDKLRKEISGQISWTKSGSQHLTLKFFDYISQTDVNNISLAVEKRTASASPLSLTVEKLGVFPDIRNPRVLWSGITGDMGRLMALQEGLEADFEGLGFPRENRPFRAHLTLARFRTFQAVGSINAVLGRHDHFSAGEFICRELILFQSNLTPQGAIYTKLAEFALGG